MSSESEGDVESYDDITESLDDDEFTAKSENKNTPPDTDEESKPDLEVVIPETPKSEKERNKQGIEGTFNEHLEGGRYFEAAQYLAKMKRAGFTVNKKSEKFDDTQEQLLKGYQKIAEDPEQENGLEAARYLSYLKYTGILDKEDQDLQWTIRETKEKVTESLRHAIEEENQNINWSLYAMHAKYLHATDDLNDEERQKLQTLIVDQASEINNDSSKTVDQKALNEARLKYLDQERSSEIGSDDINRRLEEHKQENRYDAYAKLGAVATWLGEEYYPPAPDEEIENKINEHRTNQQEEGNWKDYLETTANFERIKKKNKNTPRELDSHTKEEEPAPSELESLSFQFDVGAGQESSQEYTETNQTENTADQNTESQQGDETETPSERSENNEEIINAEAVPEDSLAEAAEEERHARSREEDDNQPETEEEEREADNQDQESSTREQSEQEKLENTRQELEARERELYKKMQDRRESEDKNKEWAQDTIDAGMYQHIDEEALKVRLIREGKSITGRTLKKNLNKAIENGKDELVAEIDNATQGKTLTGISDSRQQKLEQYKEVWFNDFSERYHRQNEEGYRKTLHNVTSRMTEPAYNKARVGKREYLQAQADFATLLRHLGEGQRDPTSKELMHSLADQIELTNTEEKLANIKKEQEKAEKKAPPKKNRAENNQQEETPKARWKYEATFSDGEHHQGQVMANSQMEAEKRLQERDYSDIEISPEDESEYQLWTAGLYNPEDEIKFTKEIYAKNRNEVRQQIKESGYKTSGYPKKASLFRKFKRWFNQ